MELKVSNEFIDSIIKSEGELCLISPYNTNNIIILIEKKEEIWQFNIYKYYIDQKQAYLKFSNNLNQKSSIFTALQEEIRIWFILPGKKYNEIIIVSEKQDIWRAFINSKDELVGFQLLIKKLKFSNLDYQLDDIFYNLIPNNIFPYFINDSLSGIVIFFDGDCFIILNSEKIQNNDNIFLFPYEKDFISDDNGLLNISLFSKENGIIIIKITDRNYKNDFPFQIKKIDEYNTPLDIYLKNGCLFIVGMNYFLKYPNFKKSKERKKYPFIVDITIAWHNTSKFNEYLLIKENNHFALKYTNLNSSNNDIVFEDISITNNFDFKFKKGSNSIRILKLANSNFGLIYNEEEFNFWSFSTEKSLIGNKIHIENTLSEQYNPLECLKFIYEINFDSKYLERAQSQRKSYSREDDLFILENIYENMNLNQISTLVGHSRNSVYARFSTIYGTPTCYNHYFFKETCSQCQNNLKIWKKKVKEDVLRKEYRPRSYSDFELCKNYSKKERIIRSQTIHLRSKISPEIYDNAIKFLGQIDCLGKSIKKLFIQSLKLFIGKKIAKIGYKHLESFNLISMFVNITPDIRVLNDLKKEYENILGEKPYFFNDKTICFLRGIKALNILFEDKYFEIIRNLYVEVLNETTNPKVGFLPAIVYLFMEKKLTQNEISKVFNITEVSLRVGMKKIKEDQKILNILQKYRDKLKN